MLSNREMQCLGAAYLHCYCKAHRIVDASLTELISHLLKIICSADLPAWETEGSRLCICGRGEPIPKNLFVKLPEDLRSEFEQLVEHVVEIGIVDMYGADTDGPTTHLEKAKQILESNNLLIPKASVFRVQLRPVDGSWGDPISTSEFDSYAERILTVTD